MELVCAVVGVWPLDEPLVLVASGVWVTCVFAGEVLAWGVSPDSALWDGGGLLCCSAWGVGPDSACVDDGVSVCASGEDETLCCAGGEAWDVELVSAPGDVLVCCEAAELEPPCCAGGEA